MIYTKEVCCRVDLYIKRWPAVFGVMNEHCWDKSEKRHRMSQFLPKLYFLIP